MKTLLKIAVFGLAMMLTGCASSLPTRTVTLPATQTTVSTKSVDILSPTNTQQQASTATPTIEPTVVTIASSPTPTASAVPTIPPEANLEISCLEETLDVPQDIASEGILILEHRRLPETYLLDLASNEIKLISSSPVYGLVVSPDHTKIAYGVVSQDDADDDTGEIIIMTADGVVQASIPWPKNWGIPLGWSDDEHLIIQVPGPEPALKIPSLVLLDVSTGEQQTIFPEYPDMYDWQPSPDWDGWGITMYSPDLTRVVYLRWITPGGSYVYTLWDSQAEKILADFDVIGDPIPRWSPDGMKFIVPNLMLDAVPSRELFSISRGGEVEQLTNLLSFYPTLEIVGYSWSPDGRYIALWLNPNPYGEGLGEYEAQLAVMDINTKQVTNYCVWVKHGGKNYGPSFPFPIIWSPNGQQMVVYEWSSKNKSQTILVDLDQRNSFQVVEDLEPLGWMASPQE